MNKTKPRTTVSLPAGGGFRIIINHWASRAVRHAVHSALCRKVLVLDIDYSVINSRQVAEAERRYHERLSYTNGLPIDFFARVRTDFKQRDFDLSNMVEAIIWLAKQADSTTPADVRQILNQWTPEKVLEQLTKRHHEWIFEVEAWADEMDYPGVAAALAEIRAQHPDALIVAHTDCPAWLGLLRLHNAGLLKYFDGLMGCETLEPEWLRQSEFANCLDESHRWTEDVIRRMLEQYPDIRAVVAAAKENCKPSHVGLRVLLSTLNVGTHAALFHVDDKPMGAQVVRGLKESGTIPKAQCLHAEYGFGGQADWPGVDKSLHCFTDALPVVLAAFAAVDTN
jgi:hypothetical protein